VKRSFGELKEKRGKRDCSKRREGEIPREGRSMHPKEKRVHKNRGRGSYNKGGYNHTVSGRTIMICNRVYSEDNTCELGMVFKTGRNINCWLWRSYRPYQVLGMIS
jgi:hypothetical protein